MCSSCSPGFSVNTADGCDGSYCMGAGGGGGG